MRKFLKHILLFCLPFPVVILLLLHYSVKRSFFYHYQPEDCDNRSSWIYERIFNDKKNIDVLFLGTSHTMTGINDTLLEKLLAGKNRSVANLGYCRIGEELPYIFLKDILKFKHPKIVVLETREKISTSSHPVYPFLAETEDLLHPASYAEFSYFPNVYNGWLLRLAAFRSDVFHLDDTVTYKNYASSGFRSSDHIEDPAVLEKVKNEKQHPRPSSPFRNAELIYPEKWLSQFEKLAADNGIKVYYLYLPTYGSPEKKPEYSLCQKNIPFLIPPDSIFSSKKNWRDPDHFNDFGAKSLAYWLAEELK